MRKRQATSNDRLREKVVLYRDLAVIFGIGFAIAMASLYVRYVL